MANEPAQRIVSLVPSTTESVCELGAVGRLLARTRYCTEPEMALRQVPSVGGTKNPDLQAIASLDPDLVLANAEENRPEDIDWLAARFPTLVQTPRSIVEAGNDLRVLATRLGSLKQAEPFLLRIEGADCSCRSHRVDQATVASLLRDLAHAVDDDQSRHVHP